MPIRASSRCARSMATPWMAIPDSRKNAAQRGTGLGKIIPMPRPMAPAPVADIVLVMNRLNVSSGNSWLTNIYLNSLIVRRDRKTAHLWISFDENVEPRLGMCWGAFASRGTRPADGRNDQTKKFGGRRRPSLFMRSTAVSDLNSNFDEWNDGPVRSRVATANIPQLLAGQETRHEHRP